MIATLTAAKLAATAAMALTSPVPVSLPGHLADGPYPYTIQNAETGLCLDSNVAGSVYALACNGGSHQEWHVVPGGPVTDDATQRCLAEASGSSVTTDSQSDNSCGSTTNGNLNWLEMWNFR